MTVPVQSIERAFALLQIVSDHPHGISISTIADQAGLHLSTTSRIIATLEYVGAVQRLPNGIGLGEGLLNMVSKSPWSERLLAVARPFMEQLVQRTGEAVGLTVSDDEKNHVLLQLQQDEHFIQIQDWTGASFPLPVTSAGKLYLSQLPPAKLNQRLKQSWPGLPSNVVLDPDELCYQIQQARQQGFVWTFDELENGLATIAVPLIKGGPQKPFASLYISVPIFRYAEQTSQSQLTEQVVEMARTISEHLPRAGF